MPLQEMNVTLPSGTVVTTFVPYAPGDSAGVVALAVASGISCLSVVLLLSLLIFMALRNINTSGQLVFMRTHVAAYFVCLLFSDLIQAIGSLFSIEWVAKGGPSIGGTCTVQGAIKNGGNVGTAVWSLVIAIHTFFILFLGKRPWEPALYGTLFGVWALIGFVVVLGPGVIENTAKGPYFGISGLWCWITDGYQVERLMLEYLWMFSSAFISFILYLLVFLKLRGFLVVSGWTVNIRRRGTQQRWDYRSGRGSLEAQLASISKQMMLYPIAYIVTILPIAVCRYADWAGHPVPFQAVIFSDVVFLLSGFINTVLFIATRRILPADFGSMFRRRRSAVSVAQSDPEVSVVSKSLAHAPTAPHSPSASVDEESGPVVLRSPSPHRVNAGVPPPLPPKEVAAVISPAPQSATLHAPSAIISPAPASAAPLLSPPAPGTQYAQRNSLAPVMLSRPPTQAQRVQSADMLTLASFRSEDSTMPLTAMSRATRDVYDPWAPMNSLPPPPLPRPKSGAGLRPSRLHDHPEAPAVPSRPTTPSRPFTPSHRADGSISRPVTPKRPDMI